MSLSGSLVNIPQELHKVKQRSRQQLLLQKGDSSLGVEEPPGDTVDELEEETGNLPLRLRRQTSQQQAEVH